MAWVSAAPRILSLWSITSTMPPAPAAFMGVTERWSTGLPFSLTYTCGTVTGIPAGADSTSERSGNLAPPPIEPLSEVAVALAASSGRTAAVIAPPRMRTLSARSVYFEPRAERLATIPDPAQVGRRA
jgi:hypothetical protein